MATLQQYLKTAISAYNGTSFSPERRGANTVAEFETMLNNDLAIVPEYYHEKYTAKFESRFTAWLHSKSRCVSSMIAGPSNFPVQRMKKYNQWEDNKYSEFMNWRNRLLESFKKQERKRTQGSELEQAKSNLESRKKSHELMKKCNAIIRRHQGKDTCIPECVALGMKEETMHELLHPKHSYMGQGYPTWSLANNNAEIKRLEQRVKLLEQKEAMKQSIAQGAETPEIVVNGATIRNDFSDDRLKVIFDGKPAENVRKALRDRGFKWSGHLMAWCRKLTRQAYLDAKQICERELQPVAAAPVVPEGWAVL